MTKPLISICVPVYNGEKYLKECLDSCISQTFKDYEIVICNDGSTDKSVSIIGEFLKKNKNIHFTRNEKNLGLVGNWNKCIELAKGEWIKFLFQDDLMNPDCLEKFVQQIDSSINLIVSKRNFILDKITSEKEAEYYQIGVRTLENTGLYQSNNFSAETISKLSTRSISMNFIGEPSLTLFRKDIIEKIGLFDQDLKQICDLEFLLRIASNYGLKYIPEQLCSFRIHSSSTTEKNISGSDYAIKNLEAVNYALKILTKKEFSQLRSKAGLFGLIRIKLFVKYRSYKAFKAISSEKDEELFIVLKEKYKTYFFKFYEIPFIKAFIVLR